MNLNKALATCIERCPNVYVQPFGYTDRSVGNVVAILDSNNTDFKVSNESYNYKNKNLNINALYKIESAVNGYGFLATLLEIGKEDDVLEKTNSDRSLGFYHLNKIPYFKMFKDAYSMFKKFPQLKSF